MQGVRLRRRADANAARANPHWTRAQNLGIPMSIAGCGQPERIAKIKAIATRFPGVTVAPDHMAGWSNASEQREAMTKAIVELAGLPNAYLRISTTSLAPYDSLDENEKDMFKRILDALTPQRVMWGSNFPSSREGGYGAQVELAKTALPFLSEDDRRWILGDTALTLWPSLKGPAK